MLQVMTKKELIEAIKYVPEVAIINIVVGLSSETDEPLHLKADSVSLIDGDIYILNMKSINILK